MKISFSIIILFSLNLFSSWENDYLLGLKKFEKKNYIEAAKLFEKAIKAKSNSCEKCIREGMFFYDYFPHFYLAKCYLALGDMENFQRAVEFLKIEGKIQNNAKLREEFSLLQQSLKKEEKIAERPKEEKIAEKTKEEKVEEKITEKPKEETKIPDKKKEIGAKPAEKAEKTIEEKVDSHKPSTFPKIFQEITELDERSNNLSVQNYPKLYKKKMELSGELIFLKKKWKESKDDRERNAIAEKSLELRKKYEKLLSSLIVIDKVKAIKEDILQRIAYLESNKEKISKDEYQKVQEIRNKILKDIEDLDLKDVEDSYKTISEIKLQEKRKEFKNLKIAYSYYFQGKFQEAEKSLKNLTKEEKENPYFEFLFSLINITKYYLNENKDKNLLSNAKNYYIKAKEKGLKKEDISKIPISPKIIETYNSF